MQIIGYITINLINGNFYIGIRKLRKRKDPYLGSGKALLRAVNKYGKANFKRKTLKKFNTYEAAFAWEKQIVNTQLIARKDCYNIVIGGGASNKWSEETKLKHRLAGTYRKTDELKQKMSDSAKKRFETEPGTFTGKTHTKENREKASKLRKGQPSKNKGKKLNLSEERILKLKEPKTEETKRKISKSLCSLSDEQIRFLKEEFIDVYGARAKLAREWKCHQDVITRIIGKRK